MRLPNLPWRLSLCDDIWTIAEWLTNLVDIDKTLNWFFESCNKAGPDSCAFYEPSVEAIASKFNGLYTSVIESPIPVQTNLSYGLVDYTLLRGVILYSLYRPSRTWRTLATALEELAQGNGTFLYSLLDASIFQCDCDPEEHEFDNVPDPLMGYYCNDGDFVPPGLEEAKEHYRRSVEISSFGSFWAGFRIACKCVSIVGIVQICCYNSMMAL